MRSFYSPEDDADIGHLKVDTSSLKVSLSYYIDVTKMTISSKTKEKCYLWNERKLGGRPPISPFRVKSLTPPPFPHLE